VTRGKLVSRKRNCLQPDKKCRNAQISTLIF